MKFEKTFLRSKVARRIFFLFISCALIPITLLVGISFPWVTNELKKQSKLRLRIRNKDIADNILERVLFCEQEMRTIAFNISENPQAVSQIESEESDSRLRQHYKNLGVINNKGRYISLLGDEQNPPELTPEEKKHVLDGEVLLSTRDNPGDWPSLYLSIAGDLENKRKGILLAEVDMMYLVFIGYEKAYTDGEVPLPTGTELCILDGENNLIYSSLSPPVSFPDNILARIRITHSSQFEWEYEREKYLANYRPIRFPERFFLPKSLSALKWTAILSESKKYVFEAVEIFRKVFPLVVLLSLWVVLLLSLIQIRKSMVPLEKLKEGTQRIARREFESRVKIESRDEFEELGTSFNTMASQLGRQFKALTTIDEIDRAILSALDTERIVDTVLARMRELLPCNGVSVILFDSRSGGRGQIYFGDGQPERDGQTENVEVTPQEEQMLRNNPKVLFLKQEEDPPNYLAHLVQRGNKSFLVLPIFLKKELRGIISLGYLKSPKLAQEDLSHARQLTDQVAVALSNAQLLEDLDRLNWGTLRALARAIDAKSPWTAGHSERGTELALQIGRKLGLTQEEIDTLNRGALLHDIGKLGIGAEILDKHGKLTAKEKKLMDEHTRVGARILAPIAAYSEVIPIVLQHHEHYDGTGYPDGFAGEDISFGARIMTVADSFEALTANRPYRKALKPKQAVDYIKERSGTDFDPKVVEAFLEVMAEEGEEKFIDKSTGI